MIDGWSRLDFYHAKWLVVIGLSLLTAFYVFLTGSVFGLAYGSASDFPGSIRHLFYVWVLALNYYSFSLLLALFFRRSGITIGIFFLYCMILEALVSKFINWWLDTSAGNFMPLQCSDELLPFPILDVLKAMAQMDQGPDPVYYVLASLAWIGIYYLAGRRKLLTSDW